MARRFAKVYIYIYIYISLYGAFALKGACQQG